MEMDSSRVRTDSARGRVDEDMAEYPLIYYGVYRKSTKMYFFASSKGVNSL
jgi:hypothetical protein